MLTVNVHEAKTQLSRLLEAVEAGDEVLIARAGRPVARLVGLAQAAAARPLGLLHGKFSVPDDFDAPLADEVAALFEGR
ncbi:type II toxin-antitoxin system prevent-host-death family antitoxin [soil metagenome]